MALSLKGLASSVSGKLLTGALALGAGNAIANSAETAEITKITQAAAKFCIGADMGGSISGQELGWKGTVTDGVSTGLTTTEKTAFVDKMYNPITQQIGIHRDYAYTQYPANNDIVEGYYLYNIKDLNNVQQALVINSKNYPNYIDGVRVHFIKGATPDQDQMVFPGNNFYVYKSPFDANGKVKPECKTGPVAPDFTYKINFSPDGFRANGNSIFVLGNDGVNSNVHKLIVGQDAITEDKIVTLKGIDANGWSLDNNGFMTTKDANGTSTTHLVVDGKKLILVNTDNINDYKTTDADYDIAVEDPAGRFMFKAIDDGIGGNLEINIYITDLWANPSTSKKILSKNVGALQGNLAYAEGYPTPAWVLFGSNGKAYLIELIDAATMNFKITEVPFDTFYKNYGGGSQACVTIPGQVPTITKTGTPADAGDASVVEKDAGGAEVDAGGSPDVTAEVDAGSTDGGNDADAGSTDAVDSWVDGKGDMQDIFADVPPTPDAPDTTDTAAPDAPDVTPDQSVQEADGFTEKDAPEDVKQNDAVETADTTSNDTNETKQEVDVVIAPPDVGNPVGTDGAVGTDSGADTIGGSETKPGVDGGSSDTSPTITNTPPPKDTGCNAGANGGSATPAAAAAATLLAIRMLLARRKEEETVESEVS